MLAFLSGNCSLESVQFSISFVKRFGEIKLTAKQIFRFQKIKHPHRKNEKKNQTMAATNIALLQKMKILSIFLSRIFHRCRIKKSWTRQVFYKCENKGELKLLN